MAATNGKGRLTLDLGEQLHRQVKVAAALRRETVRSFCVEAIRTRLGEVGGGHEHDALSEMTAAADPVLAELWDNEKDAAYDRL